MGEDTTAGAPAPVSPAATNVITDSPLVSSTAVGTLTGSLVNPDTTVVVKAEPAPAKPELNFIVKAGERIIYGPASVAITDKENDLITGPGLRKGLPHLLVRHAISLQHTDIIPATILPEWGSFKTEVRPVTDVDMSNFPTLRTLCKVGDESLFLVAQFYRDPMSDPVFEAVEKGELLCFSVSGKAVTKTQKMDCNGFNCKMVNVIDDLVLSAVTICKVGMNQAAHFKIINKAAEDQLNEQLQKEVADLKKELEIEKAARVKLAKPSMGAQIAPSVVAPAEAVASLARPQTQAGAQLQSSTIEGIHGVGQAPLASERVFPKPAAQNSKPGGVPAAQALNKPRAPRPPSARQMQELEASLRAGSRRANARTAESQQRARWRSGEGMVRPSVKKACSDCDDCLVEAENIVHKVSKDLTDSVIDSCVDKAYKPPAKAAGEEFERHVATLPKTKVEAHAYVSGLKDATPETRSRLRRHIDSKMSKGAPRKDLKEALEGAEEAFEEGDMEAVEDESELATHHAEDIQEMKKAPDNCACPPWARKGNFHVAPCSKVRKSEADSILSDLLERSEHEVARGVVDDILGKAPQHALPSSRLRRIVVGVNKPAQKPNYTQALGRAHERHERTRRDPLHGESVGSPAIERRGAETAASAMDKWPKKAGIPSPRLDAAGRGARMMGQKPRQAQQRAIDRMENRRQDEPKAGIAYALGQPGATRRDLGRHTAAREAGEAMDNWPRKASEMIDGVLKMTAAVRCAKCSQWIEGETPKEHFGQKVHASCVSPPDQNVKVEKTLNDILKGKYSYSETYDSETGARARTHKYSPSQPKVGKGPAYVPHAPASQNMKQKTEASPDYSLQERQANRAARPRMSLEQKGSEYQPHSTVPRVPQGMARYASGQNRGLTRVGPVRPQNHKLFQAENKAPMPASRNQVYQAARNGKQSLRNPSPVLGRIPPAPVKQVISKAEKLIDAILGDLQ